MCLSYFVRHINSVAARTRRHPENRRGPISRWNWKRLWTLALDLAIEKIPQSFSRVFVSRTFVISPRALNDPNFTFEFLGPTDWVPLESEFMRNIRSTYPAPGAARDQLPCRPTWRREARRRDCSGRYQPRLWWECFRLGQCAEFDVVLPGLD